MCFILWKQRIQTGRSGRECTSDKIWLETKEFNASWFACIFAWIIDSLFDNIAVNLYLKLKCAHAHRTPWNNIGRIIYFDAIWHSTLTCRRKIFCWSVSEWNLRACELATDWLLLLQWHITSDTFVAQWLRYCDVWNDTILLSFPPRNWTIFLSSLAKEQEGVSDVTVETRKSSEAREREIERERRRKILYVVLPNKIHGVVKDGAELEQLEWTASCPPFCSACVFVYTTRSALKSDRKSRYLLSILLFQSILR